MTGLIINRLWRKCVTNLRPMLNGKRTNSKAINERGKLFVTGIGLPCHDAIHDSSHGKWIATLVISC